MPQTKKSSVTRLANKVAKPRAAPTEYDRHFRLPIIPETLDDSGISGQFIEYDKYPEENVIANAYGVKDYLYLNPRLNRTDPFKDAEGYQSEYDPIPPEGERGKVLKHELFHVLQAKAAKEGKLIEPGEGQNPFTTNPLKEEFWNPGQNRPSAYYNKLVQLLGSMEPPAYIMGRNIQERKNLPQNPAAAEVLRQRLLEQINALGYGKYSKIWK
jgi:hypothetical protein